jgi:kynureninase
MSRVVSESLIKSQEHTRNYARTLDDSDPLRAFRDRFVIDDELVYLDGNSLGRLPRATAERLARVVPERSDA